MKHRFSHEHNRSKMRVLQHSIIGKVEPSVVMGIILSIIGNIFEHCSKV